MTHAPYRHIVVNLLCNVEPADVYVCQIDDPALVEEWSAHPECQDPRLPSSNWCAVCCTRMILRAEGLPTPSREELFDAAQDCHAYREQVGNEELMGWQGAFHQDFVTFLWASLGLWARAERNVDLNWLRARLHEGYYILASVHPNIRFPHDRDEPEHKRGHFVLIYGFEIQGDACWFFIMNSAGFASQQSQIAVRVPNSRLLQLFSGNAIVVGSSQCIDTQNRPRQLYP